MLHKSPKDSEMRDAAIARNIIAETFDLATNGRALVIAAAFDAVKSIEARLPKPVLRDRQRAWTERRIRQIVDQEATRIDHYEIQDLKAAAIEEARREIERARHRAARMAAYLATADENFHGDEIERMGAFARGVDLPGMVRSGSADDPSDFSD